MPTLNWVFENQPMVLEILTQASGRKQFVSRRGRSLEKGGGSNLYLHPYYRSLPITMINSSGSSRTLLNAKVCISWSLTSVRQNVTVSSFR